MQKIRVILAASFLLAFVCVGSVLGLIVASLPAEDGNVPLPGLSAAAIVKSDAFGVPFVTANSRVDAYRILGFLHARDRLFQMELMRRKSAGRLSELFGSSAVKMDRIQRGYQMAVVARKVVEHLPVTQRRVLQAYVQGVNAYIDQTPVLAPEFLALRHYPEAWTPEDSVLVILGMFQTLNGQEQDERMVTVMEKMLPMDLVRFLTPDNDDYSTVLLGGNLPRRVSATVPAQSLAALREVETQFARNSVDADQVIAGSNNWVVAGRKTIDGRAIVANDMHLSLSVPNIWYRADLSYDHKHIFGVTLPGVPAIVVGGNDDVAWGFTNVTGDFVDLVRLELNPENINEYRTPQGWSSFEEHQEKIQVRDAADVELTVRNTVWGPVSERMLLGQPVAIKWIALDANAVDLGLLAMDEVRTAEQAMNVMNRAGAPPQNVVVADREGHIGWTYMGRFPSRVGFDGLDSRSWADGELGWQGYIPPDRLPRLMDPPEGFIVTANNRTLGRDFPFVIGHNWALGYRAFRIANLLRQHNNFTERDLLAIQLDTRSGVYDFYHRLVLSELENVSDKDATLVEAEQVLRAWDGHMDDNSIGAALLHEFRGHLASEVFAKVVGVCQTADPDFHYAWREMETPLRRLLTERPNGTLLSKYHDDWQQMIVQVLRQSVEDLMSRFPETPLMQLTWGEVNTMTVQHPFSHAAPMLSTFLDMPSFAGDGCASVCVKVMGNKHSASERLVLAPLHPEDAIFHMPGGQSGHPLSGHYRDQEPLWQEGIASPMMPGGTQHVLTFSQAGHS
ncbi:MAG: penicillin acylase family protein [Gammaproteobacteria bacterium]